MTKIEVLKAKSVYPSFQFREVMNCLHEIVAPKASASCVSKPYFTSSGISNGISDGISAGILAGI